MNSYALTVTATGYTVVLQILNTEGDAPAIPAGEPSAVWRDITGDTTVQTGMKMTWGVSGWEFSETSPLARQYFTRGRVQLRLDEAVRWLMLNPLQYKLDLGIATPADETALVAYKQYFIAVSELKDPSTFPEIIWPVAPF